MQAIARTPVTNQRPNTPPVIQSAVLVDAPAYGARPKRVERPVGGAGKR
jgi:hypothetical protein